MDSKLTAGDVRLMKGRCQAQIERLQAAANVTPDNELRRAIEIDVMIYQAALASLQSKPVGIVNVDARGCAANFFQLMSGGELLYTTPVQPVELPDEAPNALLALCQQVYDSRITGASVAQDVWQDCLDEMAAGSDGAEM